MPSSLLTIGERQQILLKSLLLNQAGMTVDELSNELNISRNAVTQHLTNLERMHLVQGAVQSSTGGRPSKLYALTSEGKELFPRHYDLFANMLIQLLNTKVGEQALSQYMVELGETMASQYKSHFNANDSLNDRVTGLVEIMTGLGYEARTGASKNGVSEIIADNCVFHHLADECKAVCDLDIALISTVLNGVIVNHRECMVRGGNCCRFSITE